MKHSRLEVLVFVVSLALIAGIVGYLLYAEFVGESDRPTLEIVDVGLEPASGSEGDREVRFTLRNTGGVSVVDPTVEFTATLPDGSEEKSEVSFDFLPKGSERDGRVFFPEGIGESDLEYRVVSFALP